ARMRSVNASPLGTHGVYLLTGSSRPSFFSSARIRSAVAVKVLVMLPTRKLSSTRIVALVLTSATPRVAMYVPSPGIQMPTTTPGALVAAKDLASAASRAARVAGAKGGSAANADCGGSRSAARTESARTVFDTQGDI